MDAMEIPESVRELRPHAVWDIIREGIKLMLPFLAGLGIKSWVHDHATPLMWTGALAVAALVAYSDRLPRRKHLLSSGSSDSVPRADYEKALQASATHEGVRGELKQQLEKSKGDLELTIAEVHRRGSEIDRLTR